MGLETIAIIGLAASLAAQGGQAVMQHQAQVKGRKQQRAAQKQAEQQAAAQVQHSEREVAAANRKKPDVAAILANARAGGGPSTMLTGPTGLGTSASLGVPG